MAADLSGRAQYQVSHSRSGSGRVAEFGVRVRLDSVLNVPGGRRPAFFDDFTVLTAVVPRHVKHKRALSANKFSVESWAQLGTTTKLM